MRPKNSFSRTRFASRLCQALGVMRKSFALIVLLTMLLGCASSSPVQGASRADHYSPPPGSVVLRVEVLEVEFTDLYPECDEVKDCIPFDFWYKYRARVREVISGDWRQAEIDFTHLQHAEYIKKLTRDCYVVLEPAGDELRSKVGVSFVADKLLFRSLERDRTAIKALRDGT